MCSAEEIAKTTWENPAAGNWFANQLTIFGSTVVVGARHDDTAVSDGGQTYIFDATTGARVAALDNPIQAAGDEFGTAVAVSGNTVVVGAYQDDTGAIDSGQAYVFNATTGALVATLANPTPALESETGRTDSSIP